MHNDNVIVDDFGINNNVDIKISLLQLDSLDPGMRSIIDCIAHASCRTTIPDLTDIYIEPDTGLIQGTFNDGINWYSITSTVGQRIHVQHVVDVIEHVLPNLTRDERMYLIDNLLNAEYNLEDENYIS